MYSKINIYTINNVTQYEKPNINNLLIKNSNYYIL